ncbi:MAG: hypothetical protein Q9170_008025 [Blastenia crenularia]
MIPRRSIIVVVCFIILSAIILTIHQVGKARPELLGKLVTSKKINEEKGGKDGAKENHSQSCAKDLGWLDGVDVKYPIKYAEREIVVRPTSNLKRESLTRIDETLFPKVKELAQGQDSYLELRDCKAPLVLGVPAYPLTPVDASNMVFGMATTLDRLEDSRHHIARWLAHTGAKLYVVVMAPDEEHVPASKQLKAKQEVLRSDGMDITLLPPLRKDDSYTESYFSLVKVMYTHRTDNSTWFALMDDDTFFPSVPSLKAMLKKYDTAEQYWVGAISESWWSVGRYGMMAFGGAGIFLSHELAAVLDKQYETCTKEMHPAAGGDERVMRCINGHTETKLTNEPALHQMDIYGDLSGVYESGRLPLSLHHWKGTEYPVHLMHLVSDICGDCFLQRWQFGKDIVLSNGFSIAQYPEGEHAKGVDFLKAETTWESRTVDESVNPGTSHSMSPSRPSLELDTQKIQHRLVESATVDGIVRQTYVHKAKDGNETDTVLVLYWRRELQQASAVINNTSPP